MQPTLDARRGVRRVLIITSILNYAVAFGKIGIGLATGAISISADGFHSLMDGSANLIGLFANSVAGKPPDENHPYGHRRFETLAALAIGILLLITAWEIVSGAIDRLTSGEQPEISPLIFVVLIGTLMVNLFVSWYERREGLRLNSELLLADAANTGADVFVTISVLVSMVLVSLGLTWADPVAALLIVVLIGRAAWQIVRSTGGVLVDTAPFAPERLTQIIETVPAVQRVVRARSRGPADAVQIDIDVEVAPEMTAEHSAAIAAAVRERLEQELDGVSEVEVRFAPAPIGLPDYVLTARAAADALGLTTHEVRLADAPEGKILEMHVEVPPKQTLGAAHEQVSQLEEHVRSSLPEVTDVITHIEPALEVAPNGAAKGSVGIEGDVLALLRRRYPLLDWHHIHASPYDGGYALTMHVTLPAQMTLERAHQVAETAEMLVRTEFPRVGRVTIHTEPPENK
ncbi:MAG: cation-efflux pump [Anaerolineae bacterium]|nr:cation-efflux pump [Anaerolineae bacterium]